MTFSGQRSRGRLTEGTLGCSKGHLFQVKEEMSLLKKPRFSKKEFEWKIRFPDLRRYDEIQKLYNSYLSSRLKRADEFLVKEIARRTKDAMTILDIASGMGMLLLHLSKRQTGARIIGTDVDETPLRGAMLKLRQEGSYGRVSLCVMDGKRLAVKSKGVDCLVSHFGFNNIPQTKLAFAEAARVLKGKGRMIFSALSLRENTKSSNLARSLGYGEIASEAKLVSALEQAGFRIEHTEEFYSGEWLHNPMDRLPVEGDWFAHILVQASAR